MKRTLKSEIEYCLKHFPDTRNSDITLMIKIWQMFHVEQLFNDGNSVNLKELYSLPREDDIKRGRAIIQNGTKDKVPQFVPIKWEVAKARGWEKDKWKFYREQDFASGIKSQTVRTRFKESKKIKKIDPKIEEINNAIEQEKLLDTRPDNF